MKISMGALIGLVFLNGACTTTSAYRSEVVERIAGLDETPDWATGQVAMLEEGGDAVFVNFITMGVDARPEACIKAAEETGRANMIRHIRESITTSGQVSELSQSGDPAVESLTAFLSQRSMSGARVTARYWEKVIQYQGNETPLLTYRCAAKVAIAKPVLQKQLRDAVSPSGNPEIRKKLLEAQQAFLDGVGRETSAATGAAAGSQPSPGATSDQE